MRFFRQFSLLKLPKNSTKFASQLAGTGGAKNDMGFFSMVSQLAGTGAKKFASQLAQHIDN